MNKQDVADDTMKAKAETIMIKATDRKLVVGLEIGTAKVATPCR